MWQIVLNGPGYLDTEYELPEGETLLGRSDENDIVLSGDLVSRRHARFALDADGPTVEDAGSRNGTKVNGVKIKGNVRLVSGDIVNIGENRIAIRRITASLDVRTEITTSPGEPAPKDPPTVPGGHAPPRLHAPAAPGPTPSVKAGPPKARQVSGDGFAAPVLLRQEIDGADAIVNLHKARALGAADVIRDNDVDPALASLVLLNQVSERLLNAPTIERFLEDVCEMVMDVARSRTVVALLRDATGSYTPATVRHRGAPLAHGEVPISRGVVDECVRSRVVLCVADVGRDSRFSGRESVVLYGVNQAICVPLWRGDDVIGVLYVTRDGRDATELPKLVQALTAIGHLTASGLEQQRLREKAAEEAQVRGVLQRFHASDIVDRVVKDFTSGRGPTMEERLATILFADISGFTPLTERLAVERIVSLLDEFYKKSTQVIFSFGGTIDKFIGDEVMAIFGAPYPRGDDPAMAVRAALALRMEFARMVSERPEDERCNVNIGVNTGRVLVGTVGGQRLEYTAVGDAVNVAARLTSQASPGQILISQETLRYLDGRFHVQPLGERQLKGRREAVNVYEVDDEDLGAQTMPGTIPGTQKRP